MEEKKVCKYGIVAELMIEDSEHVYREAGMIIENGIISIVAEAEKVKRFCAEKGYPLKDYGDCLIMPGFVNAHTHMYGVYSHGVPNEMASFESFLEDYWWPFFENRLRTVHILPAVQYAVIESLESGVTCLCDTLEAPFAEDGILEEECRIWKRAGLKGIVSTECSERISTENGYQVHQENLQFAQVHKQDSIRGAMCSHTTFTCGAEFIKKMGEDSKTNHILWQFHLNESGYEWAYAQKHYGMAPLEYLEALNVLHGQILASQCVCMSSQELELLDSRHIGAVHMPLSNCEVGSGVAPVPAMLKKGICVALGTDGYVNDFFAVMRAAFLFHKGVNHNAALMPAHEVFKMATENGAAVMGMEKNIGKLKKGYCADYVILKNDFPTPLLVKNVFDQLILFGKKELIQEVVTDGQVRCKEKKIPGIDKEEVSQELKGRVMDFWKTGKG